MERTAETIIASFTKRVSEQEIIPPDHWMQGAIFLNVLIGEENNKMITLEQEYMKEVIKWIDLDKSNAEAEKRAKATESYTNYKRQKAFVAQCDEFIKLSKKQATISFEKYGA